MWKKKKGEKFRKKSESQRKDQKEGKKKGKNKVTWEMDEDRGDNDNIRK